MNTYAVYLNSLLEMIVIEADHFSISPNGDLYFFEHVLKESGEKSSVDHVPVAVFKNHYWNSIILEKQGEEE